MTITPRLRPDTQRALHEGLVIPAHPLALTAERTLDVDRQQALTRYYVDAGAGGVAVGVHTTQFAIRQAGLYESVLTLARDAIDAAQLTRPFLKIAGVCGGTGQAVAEARLAADLGYDLGLVSLGGLGDWTEDALLEHVRTIAAIIPVFGFYLQPSVGGRPLGYAFWRACAEIDNVMAIKIAPFNRYQTLDVIRAVCESSRRDEIALYTGNDDNIVADLLTTYRFMVDGQQVEKSIVGGLLGHWAVWTSGAVALLDEIHAARRRTDGEAISDLLARGVAVTDANAAVFDFAHAYHGCIAGIHEVLRRQGLLDGIWCLDPKEGLSPGQAEELDRVCAAYPWMQDDAFVRQGLSRWLDLAPAGAAAD